AQEMFARHRWSRQRKCHPVLKLVAETISAARLIKRRSRPQAADQRLIEQPAIEHDVHRPVRCTHLNAAEHVVPMLHDLAKDRIKIGLAVARGQSLRFGGGGCLAEEENDVDHLVRLELQRGLKNATGIEAGAYPLGKRCGFSGKRGWVVERAISAQELSPVAGPRYLPSGEVGKRHAGAECRIPGIAGKESTRCGLDLRHDEGCGRAPRWT